MGMLLRFFGALLWGRYPDDIKARKRAGVAGIATTLVTLVVWLLMSADRRIDKVLEENRSDRDADRAQVRESIDAVRELAKAVADNTKEMEKTRMVFFEKLPGARPKAMIVRAAPATTPALPPPRTEPK